MKMRCAISLLVLFLIIQSCSKTNSPQKSARTDTLHLSVTYADTSHTPPANFELIVQEPGGKLLLDTLAPVNAPVVASLPTSDSLVDVTTVYMGSHDTAFTVRSYLGINPAAWQTFPYEYGFVVIPAVPAAPTVHETLVINTPGYASVPFPQSYRYVWFSDRDSPEFDPTINDYSTAIGLDGAFYGTNYLYSFIPALGLYYFHAQNWSKGIDTVDLSHMDTMQQVNFPRPSTYGKCYCILDGFLDTTDLSRSIMLYFSSFTPTTPDLEYPTRFVQKFQLHATFTAADSTEVTYYSYGGTISPNFLFPDPSKYSITSVQGDNFSIKFNNLSPTFYETQWKSGKINFYIFSSPDSGVQHPYTLLASLNSQKLKGPVISLPTAVNVTVETIEGMNYGSFLSYSASPSAYTTRRIASAVRLIKSL